MIYELMKRDVAWRAVPWGIAMVCVSLLFVLRTPPYLAGAIYGGISSMFLIMAVSLSSNQDLWSNFLSALPVTARQIYLARVLAVLALLWVPVIGIAATQILLTAPVLSSSPWVVGAYATLLTLSLQSALMTGLKLPRWLIFGVFFLSVVLPMPLVVFWGSVRAGFPFHLSRYALPFAAVCLMSSGAIFWRTWTVIHGKPLASSREGKVSPTAADIRARPHRLFLIRLQYFFSWLDAVYIPILFLQVATGQWLTGVFFICVLRMTPSRRWLDPLPVSRRNLLVWSSLPVLVSLTAGYMVGILVHNPGMPGRWNEITETITQGWPPSAREQSCGRKNVTPPLEYWRLSKGGAAETVRSPWGETFTPPVITVVATEVYNPYAVGCTNSQQFFDWQLARATAAVYGHHGHTPARPAFRIQVLSLGAILTCAMLTFVIVALKDWYRLNRLPKWWWISLYAVLTLGWLSLFFPAGNSRIVGGIQWLSWHLPDNLPAVFGIWATVTLSLCLLLDKLTREAELAPVPVQTVNFLSRFQQ